MLRRRWTRTAALLAAISTLAAATPVFSEPFADLYVGGSFTQTTSIREKFTGGLVGARRFRDVDYNNSFTGGARVGYWLSSMPYLGFGVDVFYFKPDIEAQNVVTTGFGAGPLRYPGLHLDVVGVTPELRVRVPLLATPEIPNGRLQPYVLGGPGFFIAHMKDTKNFAPPSPQTDTDTTFGFKLGAGLSWQFHKHMAVFAEYRFTHFEPTFACHHNLPGLEHRDRIKMDINTHHVVTGFGVRF